MTSFTLISTFPAFMSIFCGFTAFISNRKHLLNTILSLELIMLSMFWLLIILFSAMLETFLIMFFLALVACEGALALSLLVCVVKTHGNDFFNSLNSLQC